MRFPGLMFLLCATLAPQVHAQIKGAPSVGRAQAVLNTLEVMCDLGTPTFTELNDKAAAVRLQAQAEEAPQTLGSTVRRSKSWLGQLTGGPFILLVEEMTGPEGVATSCAVVSDVGDMDDFRDAAVAIMKLRSIPALETGTDGSRSFIWDDYRGDGLSFILRHVSASKKTVMVKLLRLKTPG